MVCLAQYKGPLLKGVKEAFYLPCTNKQRIRAQKKHVQATQQRGYRLALRETHCALKSACSSKLLPAAEHGSMVCYSEEERLAKAMTSQLCFHSYSWGDGDGGMRGRGGGRGRRGGMRKQW